MKEILGVNEVGVIMRENGLYLCWDKENNKWFLHEDVNKAHVVLGNRELNFERLMVLYRKQFPHDDAHFSLLAKMYMYHSDFSKSCFIETLPINWAVLYNYVES